MRRYLVVKCYRLSSVVAIKKIIIHNVQLIVLMNDNQSTTLHSLVMNLSLRICIVKYVRYSDYLLAFGCARLRDTSDASVMYSHQSALVVCLHTKISTLLNCEHNKWVGKLPECTRPKGMANLSNVHFSYTQRTKYIICMLNASIQA